MRRALFVLTSLTLLHTAPTQVAWTNANPATAPSFRKYTVMVWDSVRERVLLFGGQGDLETYFNDTWEWDGTRWTELAPLNRPPQREDHMMAFDRDRGRAVLFGGHDVNVTFFDDTWEWDGTDWIRCTPANRPIALAYAAMAYDPVRRVSVMFGGVNSSLTETGGTYEWNGTNWATRLPGTSPSHRSHHAMAWDPDLGKVVLYGGYRTNAGWLNDYWAWDGTSWTQIGTGPSMMDMRMVYDTVRGRMVIWGGRLQLGEQSWEYVSGQWVMRTATGVFPVGRQAHTMAFDERNGCAVMFAGYDDVTRWGETWLYQATAPASTESFGHNCGTGLSNVSLHLAAAKRPWLGEPMTLIVDPLAQSRSVLLGIGQSRTSWGALPLPFDLTALGMPGCDLLASMDVLLPMTPNDTGAEITLLLDSQAFWLGRSLYLQGAVLDPTANAIGVAFTNGLRMVLGVR